MAEKVKKTVFYSHRGREVAAATFELVAALIAPRPSAASGGAGHG